MKLNDILDIKSINTRLQAGNKKALLESMLDLAYLSGRLLNKAEAKRVVYEREKIKSTGIGNGIAIPHARSNSISGTTAAFAILDTPVDYDSVDGQPVSIVCLLLGRDNKVGSQLRLLSRITRLLKDSNLRESLLLATKPEEVMNQLRLLDEERNSD